jgi:putative transposase
MKAYKYRIYPTHAQVTKLEQTLGICCELYNAALQERRDAWRISRRSVSYYEQQNQLPGIKQIRDDMRSVHSQVLCDTLARLDKAFVAFFRRIQAGEKKVGFPRFRSRARYDSFTYSQSGFAIKSSKLRLSKIGRVKIKLHRPIEGKIKTCTITKSATGKWFACFTAEFMPEPMPACADAVGVDVGIKTFAHLSTGEAITNPKFFRKAEHELARVQRKLSAAKKGTIERAKARKVVARVHERIANKRRDFAHQESRRLVNRFGIIVFENLNISGMLKNHCLAKSIADAAWNQLVQFTIYKAAYADRKCIQVNPRNTSKACSSCGSIVEKDLSVRIHSCSGCGLVLDRDHNAAINILSLGLQAVGASSTQTLEVAHL